MINEALYPIEFRLFRASFIQMRVNNTIINGGDPVKTEADLNAAFDQGWRPPQQFEMWVRGRSNNPLAFLKSVPAEDGELWCNVDEEWIMYPTKEEAEQAAFTKGYRLN